MQQKKILAEGENYKVAVTDIGSTEEGDKHLSSIITIHSPNSSFAVPSEIMDDSTAQHLFVSNLSISQLDITQEEDQTPPPNF